MDGEDPIFDPTKKKKKKKKMPVELEAALTGEAVEEATPAAPAVTEQAEDTKEPTDTTPAPAEVSLDDDFGMLKKKKKKKKTAAFDMSELEEAVPTESKEAEGDRNSPTAAMDINDDDMDFTLPSKKKKKKKTPLITSDIDKPQAENDAGKDGSAPDGGWGTQVAPGDETRDYTYEELLKRVFDIMREKNPEMVAGEKKRFVMKPPQMMRVGTKKSSFSNFADICKLLHRQPKHLLAFLLAELGTSGSIDGNNQLIIKGRFQQKQIEHVLRAYIKEYVTCHTCRSPDTILQKDTRLHFLQCETCGSRCSVASIKSGFQAVTGKRAALRAKTA